MLEAKCFFNFGWAFGAQVSWQSRDCHGILRGPSFVQSFLNGTSVEAKSFTPLCCCKRVAIVCYEIIALSIRAILRHSDPSAIIRSVVIIIIDSINLMKFRRSWPHICVEQSKRINPSFTNLYPPKTISFIRCRFGVKASGFHSSPYIIFWRFSKAMSDKVLVFFSSFVFHSLQLALRYSNHNNNLMKI